MLGSCPVVDNSSRAQDATVTCGQSRIKLMLERYVLLLCYEASGLPTGSKALVHSNHYRGIGQMPVIRVCNCRQRNRVPAQHLTDTVLCGIWKAVLPPMDVRLNWTRYSSMQSCGFSCPWFWWISGPPWRSMPSCSARGSEDLARHAIVARVNGTRYPGCGGAIERARGSQTLCFYTADVPVKLLLGMVEHNQIENGPRSATTAKIV
jgi:hypothetical protein